MYKNEKCDFSCVCYKEKSCRDLNADYIAKKLQEIITEPICRDDVPRICKMLQDFLMEVGDRGYRVKHLMMVIQVLEFLASKVKEVTDYQFYLIKMLELCIRIPFLEKSSDSLACCDLLEQYFTLLGNLLTVLPAGKEVVLVHKAFHHLLMETTPASSAKVKLKLRRLAMERSRVPLIVTDLLRSSSPETYLSALELVFLLVSVSFVCCYSMLDAGIFDILLTRMDLAYATQVFCKPPPDIELEEYTCSNDIMVLTLNILWILIKSISSREEEPVRPQKLCSPMRCASWALRYSFKKHIVRSQNRLSSVKLRNEIAILILATLIAFPSWDIVSSGMASDILSFLEATQSGKMKVFSKYVKFGNSHEDLIFTKTLLLIVIQLTTIDACIPILIEKNTLSCILQLVNPKVDNREIIWSPPQFWHLSEYAMSILTLLASKIPTEFIRYEGTYRLTLIIDWCSTTEFDLRFALSCMRTISSIVASRNSLLLEDCRVNSTALSLLTFTERILNMEMTLQHQRILTLLLIAIEGIVQYESTFQQVRGEKYTKIAMLLLLKCLYQQNDTFQVDQRLLLAVGSYIWGCIVRHTSNLQNFVEKGAIYLILDIIEIATFPVRCLFLGILTDMCEGSFCGVYLSTWRCSDKENGLMALLAKIWRQEEIRSGVKKREDGTTEDVELPQMGLKQWTQTYQSKLTFDVSPTLIDMIGSVRSKIYSIRKIIEKQAEVYKMTKEHYKILCNSDLSYEDRVTISCMDFYFRLKQGQMWTEISRYFTQAGINPLGMDGQVMFLMIQRYHSWGLFMKERQRKLQVAKYNAGATEEKKEYMKIRNSKLAPTFEAFDEIDYVRRTTDRSYMLRMKNLQRSRIDSHFPSTIDTAHSHRTLQHDIDVTAVFDQHYMVWDRDFSAATVFPIFSTASPFVASP